MSTSFALRSTASRICTQTLFKPSVLAGGSRVLPFSAVQQRRLQSTESKSSETKSTLATGPTSNPQTVGTSEKAAIVDMEGKDIAELAPVEDVIPAYEASGAPAQLLHRPVRIYQPTRNTMQSGGAKGEKWRIDWDTLPSGGRWENPLMGWASSADYMQGTRLTFFSMEDAVRFAEKQGWDYYVQPTTIKRIPAKNYGENYSYKPHKLRIARTK